MSENKKQTFCKNQRNPYPFYSPRFWAGMRLGDYVGMLARNRFRIHPSKYAMTALVGGCAVISSVLSVTQTLLLNRRIMATELPAPPVFVVGHWRSGTTLLHELLALDKRFGWPSTFQCFVPTHQLLSRPVLHPLTRLLLPAKRPMDSMPSGPAYPQEDEFALIGLGAPTPYYHMAFCNEPACHLDVLNLEQSKPADRESIRQSLNWFYKSLTYANNKRLILKSPTHTGRIGYLAKWFPGARFIHITRDPHKIFPSTIHLWRSLSEIQGYQLPRDQNILVEYVNNCYQEMYHGFFNQSAQLSEEELVTIRFEDLIRNPAEIISGVYDRLGLGDFAPVRPAIQKFWTERQNHRGNRTQLDDETRDLIDRVWARYRQQFGYASANESSQVRNAAG